MVDRDLPAPRHQVVPGADALHCLFQLNWPCFSRSSGLQIFFKIDVPKLGALPTYQLCLRTNFDFKFESTNFWVTFFFQQNGGLVEGFYIRRSDVEQRRSWCCGGQCLRLDGASIDGELSPTLRSLGRRSDAFCASRGGLSLNGVPCQKDLMGCMAFWVTSQLK